jgi:hypothetical protein
VLKFGVILIFFIFSEFLCFVEFFSYFKFELQVHEIIYFGDSKNDIHDI